MHERFQERIKSLGLSSKHNNPTVDKSGEPPDDGDMEARVAKLEDFVVDARDRLTRIESRLDHTATKADLHKEINAQTWKLVTFVCGFGGLLTAAVYFIAKHAAA